MLKACSQNQKTHPELWACKSRACSSLLPSSIHHQPKSLQPSLRSENPKTLMIELQLSVNVKSLDQWVCEHVYRNDSSLEITLYLDPWCRKPKQSRNFAKILKASAVLFPLRSKSTIFSTKRDKENRTATPWTRKSGAKITWTGICRAVLGVPWDKIIKRIRDL